MKSLAKVFVSGALIVATWVSGSSLMTAPLMTAHAAALHDPQAQVEPNVGQWETWVLKSGSELRLPAPPNRAATRQEIAELKALAPVSALTVNSPKRAAE